MIPINYTAQHVRTGAQWNAYKRVYRLSSLQAAMRRYALEHGKAICFHCDDSATIVERNASNKSGLSIHRLKPGQVSWHEDGRLWDSGWNAYGKGLPCPDSSPHDYKRGYYAARSYYLDSVGA